MAPYYAEVLAHLRSGGQRRFMVDSDGVLVSHASVVEREIRGALATLATRQVFAQNNPAPAGAAVPLARMRP